MARPLGVLTLIVMGLALSGLGADKRTTQSDWIYLQNGSGVRVSIETYRAKEGWTPVIVSIAGAEVSAVMDGQGRVVQEWAKGLDKPGLTLFSIELAEGRITFGNEVHAVRVYEQNNARTRFGIAESVIPLPVRLDQTGRSGELRFGGLEIPAQVSELDRAAIDRVARPAGIKQGLAGVRTMGLAAARPAGAAAPSPIAGGFGAKARLVPSRLRASGK